MNNRYFDTTTDDDFDEHGVLKDGKRFRVSLQMRDAAMLRHTSQQQTNVVTDGRTTDPTALNRPGFRVPVVNDRRAVHDAYAKADKQASHRWKCQDNETLCPDCDGEGFTDGERCDRCGGDGTLPLEDQRESGKSLFGSNNGSRSDAQTMRDQAYQTYDAELANAWRRG